MADYTELVSTLRECSKQGKRYGMAVIYMEQAADAIEKLEKKMLDWQAVADEHREAYQHWFHNYMNDIPKWISVTERLPEKDGAYLVCFGNGLITTDPFMTFEDGHTKWYDGGYDIGGITHWMPLPEPPKEEA